MKINESISIQKEVEDIRRQRMDDQTQERDWLRPSEINVGSKYFCVKKIKYAMNGTSQKISLQNILILSSGTEEHDAIRRLLWKSNYRIYNQEKEVLLNLKEDLKIKNIKSIKQIKGHIDGMLKDATGFRYLVEIKTITTHLFTTLKEPKKEHLIQAMLYFLALKKILNNELDGIYFIYINRDNRKIKEFTVTFDDEKEIIDTLKPIILKFYLELEKEVEDIDRTEDKAICKNCPYIDSCWENYNPQDYVKTSLEINDEYVNEELAEYFKHAKEIKEMKTKIKLIEKEQSNIKVELDKVLDKNEVNNLVTDSFKLKRNISFRNTIDYKSFLKKYEFDVADDIFIPFKKQTRVLKYTVKEIEKV